jgi:hypothetical protein
VYGAKLSGFRVISCDVSVDGRSLVCAVDESGKPRGPVPVPAV